MIIDNKDKNTFFKRRLASGETEDLNIAINVAYLDMCRTLTGFSNDEEKTIKKEKAILYISKNITKLYDISDRNKFDREHEKICEGLRQEFNKKGNVELTIGQAQKWINMTLKYMLLFDEDKVSKAYMNFHVPIDSIILDAVKQDYKKAKKEIIKEKWSKISDYKVYLKFQNNFRDVYSDTVPIIKEFNMWLDNRFKKDE